MHAIFYYKLKRYVDWLWNQKTEKSNRFIPEIEQFQIFSIKLIFESIFL